MRRALDTAYHMFKKHPNFHKIKVLVDPNLMEEFDSVKGIPGDTYAILDEY